MPQGGELAFREKLPDLTPDSNGLFAGDQFAAWIGLNGPIRVLHLDGLLLAKVVDGKPGCDGVNPGREGVFRVVEVQFSVGRDEGGLQQILREMMVACFLVKKGEQPALEPGNQLLK